MAAKKSAANGKSSKASKSKATAPAKKAKAAPERLALATLRSLPMLTGVRRRAYTASFSAEQCREWGSKIKAETVLTEAEGALRAVSASVKKGIDGYSPSRFAWLCTQMAELQDAIARQGGDGARSTRLAATSIASRIRTKLAHGLLDAASGNEAMIAEINKRDEGDTSAGSLETTITGLLQLAMRLRHVPEGEVLADDAGLTESFLSSASATLDSLRASNEVAYSTAPERDESGDAEVTNAIEGRVLRELHHLREVLTRAKARGISVPAFPALKSLKTITGWFGDHTSRG